MAEDDDDIEIVLSQDLIALPGNARIKAELEERSKLVEAVSHRGKSYGVTCETPKLPGHEYPLATDVSMSAGFLAHFL